ncbi:carboxylating nicotinate-nucleotide diphosphorylase [Corynebacterium phoceense]|uniref:Nicotinate-nucleotide pyrophosphorylase [carboxylating] n=1 Tax=Corynebacterium phoceense TaxID=1686286 RepID=A0A540R6E0_9CORY|nr:MULTISPECIES: carboxylating nicotinate-nucleotide diphosphorylase [Corynebacterium]KXB55395.1 nicotinate-nucleotide diphosphorylase [Corynebacterium sp. DNF00584]MCQ9340901.1 carboxylating nicotinate-nucleotide diphosphorylase [Corynebacterium phoceense]MCQ9348421.1 carboxylating nicotinate-nucleotide diphosphorylase [Corynebacterium phoceense]TQE43305.1 carboxylating nicotinate-nucleotide diphosphorylase [Corynebacterium phoceense]
MLTSETIRTAVAAALREDAPWGDITAEAAIPAEATLRVAVVAREPGVFAGGAVIDEAFRQVSVAVTELAPEGTRFVAGERLAVVEGPARAILTAERTALNFAQRMSAIATLTARFVELAGPARIADTRKTTPGLRAFEKHAVRVGGGTNHRFGLSDAVMVKDNHLAALGVAQAPASELTVALRGLRERVGHTTSIIVEVDRLDQVEAVVNAGVDTILLDNFALADVRAAVELIAGRVTVEASGNVNLETVAEIAATGVDVISVGAITHSAGVLDLGLDEL